MISFHIPLLSSLSFFSLIFPLPPSCSLSVNFSSSFLNSSSYLLSLPLVSFRHLSFPLSFTLFHRPLLLSSFTVVISHLSFFFFFPSLFILLISFPFFSLTPLTACFLSPFPSRVSPFYALPSFIFLHIPYSSPLPSPFSFILFSFILDGQKSSVVPGNRQPSPMSRLLC